MKIWNQSILKSVGLSLASMLLLQLTSCASRKYTAVEHRAYTKLPDNASSRFWRGLAKSSAWSSRRAFHGNWGGPGDIGGKPVDPMDEGFRRHDIVYHESRCGKHLKEADRALIEWLKAIDPDTLDPKARKYRVTAIKFMESPISNFVGKPLLTMVRKRERKGCYFESPDVVNGFFDLKHSGFP